ncbi:lipid-A-disaccharide synthase [Oricola cellulosilytica]|uniref:Lipid-A-disaccharide synthase n=1 Tax=Oricola cellulosilytica TaxID=1429082 RepID=A0A4R0PBD4_9HYPH|nr:lipid-A-disaccharide synthase [Oricola cellulosilytica]TCD13204.1 lipid-A-disaccharide synthase [Oricola cellulosilytica]
MTGKNRLTLAIVAGEQSGENLAVDLVEAVTRRTGEPPDLVGVGGHRLGELGLESVFDPAEIAITGVSAVIATLPRLILRIQQTTRAIINARPDAVVFVDSPDFSHRVGQRVREALPDTPLIKYVAPTVWAWRPDRARKMGAAFDHVLAILPFEPEVMRQLSGPETHYVGHPLAIDPKLAAVWAERQQDGGRADRNRFRLVVLPGSRRGEVSSLLPDFEAAVDLLHERGNDIAIDIPTLPRLEREIRNRTASWRVAPRITTTPDEKLEAFRNADVALAASGTVVLELALAGVPVISCYRTDPLMKPFLSLITTWSAALPNIISDRPIVPEYINEMIRPGMLARRIEELVAEDSIAATLQRRGFADVRDIMMVDTPPGEKAAEIVLNAIGKMA